MILTAKSEYVDSRISDLEEIRDDLPESSGDAKKLINAAIEILRSVGTQQRVEDEVENVTGFQPRLVDALSVVVNDYGNNSFQGELSKQKKINSWVKKTQSDLSSSKKKWDTAVDDVISLSDSIIKDGPQALSKGRVRSFIRTQLDTAYSNFSSALDERSSALDEAEAIPLVTKTKKSQERVVSELIKDSSLDDVVPLIFPDDDEDAAKAQLEKMNRAYHDRQKKIKAKEPEIDDNVGSDVDPRKFNEVASQIDQFFSNAQNSLLSISGNWILPYIPNDESVEKPIMSILRDLNSSLARVISSSGRYKRNVMYSSAIYLVPALAKTFNSAMVHGLENNDVITGSMSKSALGIGSLLEKGKGIIDKFVGKKVNPKKIDKRSLTNMTGWVSSNGQKITDIVKLIPDDAKLHKELRKFANALNKASRKSSSLSKKYQSKQPNLYFSIQSMSVFWKGLYDSITKGLS